MNVKTVITPTYCALYTLSCWLSRGLYRGVTSAQKSTSTTMKKTVKPTMLAYAGRVCSPPMQQNMHVQMKKKVRKNTPYPTPSTRFDCVSTRSSSAAWSRRTNLESRRVLGVGYGV